jgi:hypothetical protein
MRSGRLCENKLNYYKTLVVKIYIFFNINRIIMPRKQPSVFIFYEISVSGNGETYIEIIKER